MRVGLGFGEFTEARKVNYHRPFKENERHVSYFKTRNEAVPLREVLAIG